MPISSVSSNHSYNYQAAQTQKNQTADISHLNGIVSGDGIEPNYKLYNNATLDSNSSTKWGFKIDEKGFFGADFNKAAGLPENMKIHQTMMAQAENYSKTVGNNVDPLTMISKVWNLYKTVAGNTLDPDGDGYMTQKELDAMPKSYISKGSVLDGIVGIQKTRAEYDEAERFGWQLSSSGAKFYLGKTDFADSISIKSAREGYITDTGADYGDSEPEDKVAVGQLFGSFFYNKSIADMIAPEAVRMIKDFNSFLESGKDMKSYLEKTEGKDYLAELTKRLNTKPDGTFDSSMADKFFDELDKELKEFTAQYKANNYPQLESISPKEDNKESKTLKQAYGSNKNSKLPSGSLMNAQA